MISTPLLSMAPTLAPSAQALEACHARLEGAIDRRENAGRSG